MNQCVSFQERDHSYGDTISNMRKGFMIYTDAQYFPSGSSDHTLCDRGHLPRQNPSAISCSRFYWNHTYLGHI